MLQFRAVDDPERLRNVSADDLLDYQVELTGGGLGGARFGPTADGYSLGLDAEVRIGAGIQTRGIPLLIGHTRDEFALFTLTNEAFEHFDDDALLVAAAPQFGGRTAEGIDRYRAARDARGESTDAASVYTAIMTDSMFRIRRSRRPRRRGGTHRRSGRTASTTRRRRTTASWAPATRSTFRSSGARTKRATCVASAAKGRRSPS